MYSATFILANLRSFLKISEPSGITYTYYGGGTTGSNLAGDNGDCSCLRNASVSFLGLSWLKTHLEFV